MSRLDRCYNIADLREAARRRLPKGVFDYVDKGTEDEVALAGNAAAFRDIKLLNHVLADISDVRLDADILGSASAMPLVVAPTGVAGLCWHEGELELAKAAARAGVPFTLATGSNTSMEKIAKEAGGRLWFQLYMWREKHLSDELVRRAERAGFEALVWTVDVGHGANREHNARNGFALPYRLNARSLADVVMHPRWLANVLARYLAGGGMPRQVNYPQKHQHKITAGTGFTRAARADKLGWDDVDRLRALWPGKLILKGIMRADDAREAARHGVDAIVVSNHGGRNMDSAPSPLAVLPSVVEAVAGRMGVIVDSGVRRGSDIVKALALGADCVLTGRATLYGVGGFGAPGAEKALAILKDEMRRTMAYVGLSRTADVDGGIVWRPQVGSPRETHETECAPPNAWTGAKTVRL